MVIFEWLSILVLAITATETSAECLPFNFLCNYVKYNKFSPKKGTKHYVEAWLSTESTC